MLARSKGTEEVMDSYRNTYVRFWMNANREGEFVSFSSEFTTIFARDRRLVGLRHRVLNVH